MKKILLFDMDNTITPSKDVITVDMLNIFSKILQKYRVWVVTWWSFDNVEKQILNFLDKDLYKNLFIISENGMKIFRFDWDKWIKIFNVPITYDIDDLKNFLWNLIIEMWISDEVFFERRWEILVCKLIWDDNTKEDIERFDPFWRKREKICEICKENFKDLDFYVAWRRSIDIMPKWINKCYAILKIIDQFKLKKSDVVFFGDSFNKFWNDSCVKSLWIDYYEVSNYKDTIRILKEIYLVNWL